MGTITVEIVVAWPDRSESRVIALPEGTSAIEASRASGLDDAYAVAGMAVFGRRVGGAIVLQDGDRLELLRALTIDPKEARRRRAETAPALKQKAR